MGCRGRGRAEEDPSVGLNPYRDKGLWPHIQTALHVTEEGLLNLYLPVTLKCDTEVC